MSQVPFLRQRTESIWVKCGIKAQGRYGTASLSAMRTHNEDEKFKGEHESY